MTDKVAAATTETAITAATPNIHGDLFSLLDDFHVNLALHLQKDPDPSRRELMEDQLHALQPMESKEIGPFYETWAIATVGNIARISPNWRNRKNTIAKLLIELYVAIACVDKSPASRTTINDNKGDMRSKKPTEKTSNPSVDTNAQGCLPGTLRRMSRALCGLFSAGPVDSSNPMDESLLTVRIELLRDSNELLNFYRDAVDAHWMAMPIYRLLLEVLYSLPPVLERRKQKHGIASLDAVLHNLCRIKEENCVLARLVVHAAKGITSMSVNHRGNAATAAATVIVGAAKSVLTMKVDAMLLDGLHKSAVCGFEMFKHYKAADQFKAVEVLCPSLPSAGAVVDYAQLLDASKRAESTFENWLLMSAYINNLMKIAFAASRALTRDGKNADAIKILRASLVGDSQVLGVCEILRRLRKRKRRRFRRPDELLPFDVVQGAFLNAEAVLSILRQRAMEGFGEVIESVENQGIQLLENTCASYKRIIEDKVLEEAGKRLQRAGVGEKLDDKARQMLDELSKLLNGVKAVRAWMYVFLKATKKAVNHMRSLECTINLALEYAKTLVKYGPDALTEAQARVEWRHSKLNNEINDPWMRFYANELDAKTENKSAGGGPAGSDAAGLTANDKQDDELRRKDMEQWLKWACQQAEQAKQGSPTDWFTERCKVVPERAAGDDKLDKAKENVLLSILLLDQTRFLLKRVRSVFEYSRRRVEKVNELLEGDKRTGKKGIIDGLKDLRTMLQPRSRNSLISVMLKKSSTSSFEEAPKKLADLGEQLQELFTGLQKGEQALFPQMASSGEGMLSRMAMAGGFVLHFAIDAIGRAERTFSDLADMGEDDVKLMSGLVTVPLKDLRRGLKERAKQVADEGREEAKKAVDEGREEAEKLAAEAKIKAAEVTDQWQSAINGAVREAVGVVRSTMKDMNVLATAADGWGVTIADLWTNMADDASAFGIIREGLQTYFGPGPRPELVEESALLVCLELQPLLQQLLQWVVSVDPKAIAQHEETEPRGGDIARIIENLHSGLHLVVEATAAEIFSSRTTSPHANVQRLFYVAEYRPLVQYTVQSNWQALGDAVMESHFDAVAEEKALTDSTGKYENTLGGGDDGRIIDKHQVAAAKSNKHALEHCQLKALKTQDRVNATVKAINEDLGDGPAGVAGLATSALLQLTDVSYQIERVHEKAAVTLRKVDDKCEPQTASLDGIERLFDPENPPPKLTPLEEADQRNNALTKRISEQDAEIDTLQKVKQQQEERIRELERSLLMNEERANREDDIRRGLARQDELEYENARLQRQIADADAALRDLDASNARVAALEKQLAEVSARGSFFPSLRRPEARISDDDIEAQRLQREAAQNELQDLRRRVEDLTNEKGKLNSRLQATEEEGKALSGNYNALLREVEELRGQQDAAAMEMEGLRAEALSTAAVLAQRDVELRAQRDATRVSEQNLRAALDRAKQLQAALDKERQTVAALKARATTERIDAAADDALRRQLRSLEGERDAANAEITRLREEAQSKQEQAAAVLAQRDAELQVQQDAHRVSEQNLLDALKRVKQLEGTLDDERSTSNAFKEMAEGSKQMASKAAAEAREWERKRDAAAEEAERLKGDLEELRRGAAAAECSNCARLQEDMRALQTQVAAGECDNCAQMREEVQALQGQVAAAQAAVTDCANCRALEEKLSSLSGQLETSNAELSTKDAKIEGLSQKIMRDKIRSTTSFFL